MIGVDSADSAIEVYTRSSTNGDKVHNDTDLPINTYMVLEYEICNSDNESASD